MTTAKITQRALQLLPDRAERALWHAARSIRSGRIGGWRPRRAGRRPAALVPIPVLGAPDAAGSSDAAPAVLLVALGLDQDGLVDLVDALLDLGRRGDRPRVLLVVDCDAFHVLRSHRLPFEYLPPRQAWEQQPFGLDYDAFRQARLAELLAVYAPDRVLFTASADDLRGVPRVLFTA